MKHKKYFNIKDRYDKKENKVNLFEYHVYMILECIIHIKYLSEIGKFDPDRFSLLINSIIYLRNDWYFKEDYDHILCNEKTNYYDIYKIFKDSYNNLYENYSEYIKKENKDEDLNIEHLLDLKYYVEKFKIYMKGDKDFENLLNYDWSMLIWEM